MLQYLINTTAIWLMSLVLFDVFLRRESYHNYNRFYLLFTFLLGALLPLWQWQDAGHVYTGTFQRPVEQVISAKQTIVTAAIPATTTFHWEQWLLLLYCAGMLAALALIAIDIIKLVNYYRSGTRSPQHAWTIVSTGKDHAPFSFRHLLFVNTLEQYSPGEWQMIVLHEQRHTTLLHFIDLLLMQLARIVFWFHPLMYLYSKRLLLVHEYQADNAAAQQPRVYGSFLVEQAMLQTAPSLAHSFNRSPIKNRIIMLTRKSSTASRTKMLVFLPLALVCIVCFSRNGFSQNSEKKSKISKHLVFAFGTSGNSTNKFSYAQMLAHPVVACKDKGCEIIEYSISFLAKGQNYRGPFKIKNSGKINGKALAYINTLKTSEIENCRVFIDDIHLKCNDKDEIAMPLFYSASLK